MLDVPSWIENLDTFAVRPPYYGLGAVDLTQRPVVAFDTETYAMPVQRFRTASGREKMYMRRKAPRLVCATFAGRGRNTPVPESISQAAAEGHALVYREGAAWKAIVDRSGAEAVFHELLEDDRTLLVAHNTPFDLGVVSNAWPTLLPAVFRALQQDRVTDTMIREMLLKTAFGQMQDDGTGRGPRFGLAAVAKEYNLADRSHQKKGGDVWRVRYHELDGVALQQWPEAAIQYALDDAVDALMILLLQAPLGKERRSDQFFPVSTPQGGIINETPQARAHWALHLMGLWGLRVDPVLYESWGREIEAAVTYARAVARKAGFLRPNGTINKKKLQEYVRDDYNARGEPYPLTPKGNEVLAQTGERPDDLRYVSTSKETLLECKRLTVEYEGDQIEVLRLWGETAFMIRMQSTYYEPAGMGRNHAMLYDFNPLVATGRTSGRAPNMQNPPRAGSFRELFVARPGKVLSSVDYAAEELRTLAQLHYWWFGSSALREAFLAEEDPHAMFGAMLAGETYEDFKTWKRSPDKAKRKRFKDLRQAAKAANFGYPGGLGPEKFIRFAWDTYRVDLAEVAILTGFAPALERSAEEHKALQMRYAKTLKSQWLRQWVEAKRYMDLIGDEVRHADTFTYLLPVSWRQRGGCYYTSGNNTGFQGLAADAAKEALWRVAALCYLEPSVATEVLQETPWPDGVDALTLEGWGSKLYGCRPVLFIHDEILVEGPEETAHLWARAQAEVMSAAAQIYTPDVPQIAEEAIMRRWYKGAEPVWQTPCGSRYEDRTQVPVGEKSKLVPWEPPQG